MPDDYWGLGGASWSEYVESRLLGVVEDEHRQYAIEVLLKQLQTSLRALSDESANSCEEHTMLCSGDIYEIHEMRAKREHRNHKLSSAPVKLPLEEQERKSLLLSMKSLLQLLNWLVTTFWSDCFSAQPLPEQWIDVFVKMMALAKRVDALGASDEDLKSAVQGITTTLQQHLTDRDYTTLEDEDVTGGRLTDSIQTRNLEEKMVYVDQRLESYDALFSEIVADPTYQHSALWLSFLEKNEDLLLDESILRTLFTVALNPPDIQNSASPRILKLCLRCLGKLPLPIFLNVHDWLWGSPERLELYSGTPGDDYGLSLNQTFNKMTSADTSKLAVQIGCLVLQRPEATLERLVQHTTQNQESLDTLCQVLQCLPLLRETNFLFDVVSKSLQSNRWSKTEETNLINLTVRLCQHSIFPFDLELPAKAPPMVSCRELLVKCVLPSLFTEGSRPESRIPLDRSLRLMNGLLKARTWPGSLLYTAVMSLCELLECMEKDVTARHSLTSREFILEALPLVCEGVSSLDNHNNDSHLVILWENLGGFHWSTRLKVSYHLQGAAPCYQKYYRDHLGALLILLQSLAQRKDDLDKEEELAAWSTILSSSSVSRATAEQCCQVISAAFDVSTFPLRDKSLVMSLAGYIPTCTVAEWKHAMVTIGGMLGTVLAVPYSSHFTSYLPGNVDDILVDLSVSQLLMSILSVVTSDWDHISRCYMATMQDVLTRNRIGCRDAHQRLFLAGQVFCHACCAMRLVPTEHEEALIVLGCEVLGQLEGVERSEVTQWELIQRDMLEMADGHPALVKKIRDLCQVSEVVR